VVDDKKKLVPKLCFGTGIVFAGDFGTISLSIEN